MVTRFIGKNLGKKVVRPIKNAVKYGKKSNGDDKKAIVVATDNKVVEEIVNEETVTKETVTKEAVTKEAVIKKTPKKENKKQKKNKDMVNENKLSQMEAIIATELPKANVKVEKGDKGLYERTANSTILLTEDNKMLLTD